METKKKKVFARYAKVNDKVFTYIDPTGTCTMVAMPGDILMEIEGDPPAKIMIEEVQKNG